MNETIYNTTAMTGLATISNWLPLMGVLLVAVVCIGFLLIALSTAWFKRLFGLLGMIGKSLLYFFKGALTIAAGYALYALGELLGQIGSHIPFEWIVYGIAFYIGCSVLGWIVTKVWGRLKANYKKITKK